MRGEMTFGQFIAQDIDCDVSNSMTDSTLIAFVGPLALTDAGKEEFAGIINLMVDVDTDSDYPTAVVKIPDGKGDPSIEIIKTLNRFLRCAAGYCPESTWDRWFRFPDDDEEEVQNDKAV